MNELSSARNSSLSRRHFLGPAIKVEFGDRFERKLESRGPEIRAKAFARRCTRESAGCLTRGNSDEIYVLDSRP